MNRILYGLLIGGLTIGALLAGEWYVVLFLSILFLIGQHELMNLMRLKVGHQSDFRSMILGTLGTCVFALLLWLLYSRGVEDILSPHILRIAIFTGVFYLLTRIVSLYGSNRSNFLTELLDMLLYLSIPCFLAYWITVRHGYFKADILLGMFALIWSCDVGAYYFGRRIGRRKLFPRVSPNKTWEGAVGGLVTAWITTSLLTYTFVELSATEWMGIAVIVWISSLFGDLIESKIKRDAGVKDSGTLLGEHGGILDRFDAFVGCIPFVALYLWVFQL